MREYTASAEILAGVCLITASAAGVAFGGLNPAKSEREHNSQHKGQKTMNTSSKTINRVEYIAIKSTIRTTKDGQKRRESGYYFRARINGKWQNVNELTANGVILHASGAAYMGIFNLEKARVLLPMLAELLGIAATPQMVEAAEAAQKVLDERKRKREERERATIAAGRGVFVEKKTEAAGRAFDRLCEKYAPQAEDTPATEAEAVEVAEAVAA